MGDRVRRRRPRLGGPARHRQSAGDDPHDGGRRHDLELPLPGAQGRQTALRGGHGRAARLGGRLPAAARRRHAGQGSGPGQPRRRRHLDAAAPAGRPRPLPRRLRGRAPRLDGRGRRGPCPLLRPLDRRRGRALARELSRTRRGRLLCPCRRRRESLLGRRTQWGHVERLHRQHHRRRPPVACAGLGLASAARGGLLPR